MASFHEAVAGLPEAAQGLEEVTPSLEGMAIPLDEAALSLEGMTASLDGAALSLEGIMAPRQKNDPKYIAAARELRDRYLEQVNAERLLPGANGKYDVSRQLEAALSDIEQTPLLKAA